MAISRQLITLPKVCVFGLIFLLSVIASHVHAGGQVTVGDYAIHYNTFNTTLLLPEIAKNYGVVRSKTQGLLNIAVRKKRPEAPITATQAVSAKVEASAVNLNSQLKQVKMRKVAEGDAIYYIGVFSMADQETLDFTVKVTPQGVEDTTEIKFRQQFFVD